MEASFLASSGGAARSSAGTCLAPQLVEILAARLGTPPSHGLCAAVRRSKPNECQPQLLNRLSRPKITRTPKALLADDHAALQLDCALNATLHVSCREQELDLSVPQRTVCVASAWVQAQGISEAVDEQGMSSANSGVMQVGGLLGGADSLTGSSAPLMAFELLSTTASSGACTPSAEVHVLAAAVSASVAAHGDQQQPDTSIAAAAAVADQERQQADRAINALMVGAAAIYATTKLLTVDHDYWHGWTVFEILRYAPMHNWSAYEQALKSNPVLAKMMISGIVYSLGDWIAQCYEGKPVLDFKRERMIRSGLVGFCLHGSLSHYYYHVCEALFPFKEWWVVPLKVAFDQTIWSGFWNSVYFVVLGLLRLESPLTIASELKSTFWPLLTAGWKLWPFAHLITYGFVPVEQRLLWVDMVELVWVTILSMYSNEKAEARLVEASASSENATAADILEADNR